MQADAPSLRPVAPGDVPALARALALLPLFTAYKLDAPALEARFRGALERGEGLWLAEETGAPVGVCWFLRRGSFGTGAYLRTLAVAPGRHGGGLGARLLEAYERETADAPGGWFLLVSDFNDGAQRFYARHGYQEVGRLPGFAAPGVTERIFWKPRTR